MDGSNNLEACQSACQEDENCSAINFYKTGGCTLRACPYPVPAPRWRLSDHVGYYKSSGIKICICLIWKFWNISLNPVVTLNFWFLHSSSLFSRDDF